MRECQVEAITSLEESFAEAHPRALIQMATGAGKTFTACAFTYRLIKHAGAKRVLFLVDRANLGRQATAEFQQFVTPDTAASSPSFTTSSTSPRTSSTTSAASPSAPSSGSTRCCAARNSTKTSTRNPATKSPPPTTRPKDVAYNPAIPIETFDFIVTDECHRSIYNLWRQVLEYFDAFLIGLTATPSKQTIGFFNQNLVTEYNHERAVADGVNVGYEVYRIKTQVTEQGGTIEKGWYVDQAPQRHPKGALGAAR